jgi:hypothetical protein
MTEEDLKRLSQITVELGSLIRVDPRRIQIRVAPEDEKEMTLEDLQNDEEIEEIEEDTRWKSSQIASLPNREILEEDARWIPEAVTWGLRKINSLADTLEQLAGAAEEAENRILATKPDEVNLCYQKWRRPKAQTLNKSISVELHRREADAYRRFIRAIVENAKGISLHG